MGIMINKDCRPADWTYIATFDKKDLPSLEEMARRIRETHDITIIEDFNLKCEQKLRDQSATLDNGLEIKAVTKTGDLIVNGGLDQCIKIIQGTSTARWTHFGMAPGTGSSPTVADTALVSETVAHRVSLAWAEPIGMKMFFGAISSQSDGFVPTTVGEIGVYNGSAAGAILLNRSMFPNAAPKSNSNTFVPASAPIVLSTVIEFCPVA